MKKWFALRSSEGTEVSGSDPTPRSQWLWAWLSLPVSSFLHYSLCSTNADREASLGSTVSGGGSAEGCLSVLLALFATGSS
jgi:hypothetical protein